MLQIKQIHHTPQGTRPLHNTIFFISLQWRHNEHDGVSNHRRLHCLLNCWFRRRSKKTSKLCVSGLCAQKASNAENVSIWCRHHVHIYLIFLLDFYLKASNAVVSFDKQISSLLIHYICSVKLISWHTFSTNKKHILTMWDVYINELP